MRKLCLATNEEKGEEGDKKTKKNKNKKQKKDFFSQFIHVLFDSFLCF